VSRATAAAPRPSLLLTRSRATTRLAFGVIYLLWGITYAVNRIMVLELPPLLAAGTRFMLVRNVPLIPRGAGFRRHL
jgi:hypothetical protein